MSSRIPPSLLTVISIGLGLLVGYILWDWFDELDPFSHAIVVGVLPTLCFLGCGLAANSIPSSINLGVEGLVGQTGMVTRETRDGGQVRVGAELWSARSSDGAALPEGATVSVVSVDGLVLEVVRSV